MIRNLLGKFHSQAAEEQNDRCKNALPGILPLQLFPVSLSEPHTLMPEMDRMSIGRTDRGLGANTSGKYSVSSGS